MHASLQAADGEAEYVCTLQDMRGRSQYGHIINISSMAGHRITGCATGASFYCATKQAVRCLTEGLRQEVTDLDAAAV